jgi:hypothetical protein
MHIQKVQKVDAFFNFGSTDVGSAVAESSAPATHGTVDKPTRSPNLDYTYVNGSDLANLSQYLTD